MKSKITPGDWSYRQYYDNGEFAGFTVMSGQADGIADVPGTTNEDEANAQAIAAVPELIDACKDVEAAWSGNGDMSTAIDAVLLALAKAGIAV